MNARSALFDLYGDHLRSRGGVARVSAVVTMMAAVGINAPAVRTAVSRMVRQGWLAPARLSGDPAYRLTGRAEQRLSAAAERIYRSDLGVWDGQWRVLVVEHVRDRTRRERVRNALSYLGYGSLRDGTWISPRGSAEADLLLDQESIRAHRFTAELDGDDEALARAAWDLDELGRDYCRWLADAHQIVGDAFGEVDDEHAFVVRSRLVHEWRKFLFRDPGLPTALVPGDWPGNRAAAYFDREAKRLLPGASRYVDACLQRNGGQR